MKLELSDAAREHVAREGYDPVYRARPLKRFLQRTRARIGRALIAGEVTDGSLIEVGMKDGALVATVAYAAIGWGAERRSFVATDRRPEKLGDCEKGPNGVEAGSLPRRVVRTVLRPANWGRSDQKTKSKE